MIDGTMQSAIERVRRFNRFYTRTIGALHAHFLQSPFSLAESRVLFELAQRQNVTATKLGRDLGLDAGYLSRMLKSFASRGLLRRTPAPRDGRRSLLSLTAKGRAAFAPLEKRQHEEVVALLKPLDAADRDRVVRAMTTIEELLDAERAEDGKRTCLVRSGWRAGDLGWVVAQHAAVYCDDFGWDRSFEGLVAQAVARFARRFDPQRENCWIAERDGERLGSVFLVRRSATTAQLRMLIVSPQARGLGLGKRLVAECVAFAHEAGYKKIMLWTVDVLLTARGIYHEAGFRLVRGDPNHEFGKDLVDEIWELDLRRDVKAL